MFAGMERRRHPRLNRQFMVRYCAQGDNDQSDLSQLRDISLGGACLTTSKAFELGTKLLLRIRLPGAEIMPTAKVLESKALGTGRTFCNTRVEFSDMGELDKEILTNRLTAYLRDGRVELT